MKNKLYTRIVWISFIIFTLLSILVKGGVVDDFNNIVATWIQAKESRQLTIFMITITNMGEWFVYIPIAIIMLMIPKSRIKIGIPVFITLMVSALMNVLLKITFAIPRPDTYRLISETGFGFPSGHAMNGTAFIGICTCLFLMYSYRPILKIALLSISIFFLLLLGISRIYLGVHSPTDILGGYSAGIFLCGVVILVMNKARNKINPSRYN